MGSQPGGGHESPVIDWVAVYVMIIGAGGLGVALPLRSWWIALAGGVLFLIGAGIALAYGIMDHTEDYELHPKPAAPVEAASSPSHRITSA